MATNDYNSNPTQSTSPITAITIGMRLKSLSTQPRLILNLLLLFVFSAAWIRDFIYWLPTDAFGDTLNYWAYTLLPPSSSLPIGLILNGEPPPQQILKIHYFNNVLRKPLPSTSHTSAAKRSMK
jgi:hypothetical protein